MPPQADRFAMQTQPGLSLSHTMSRCISQRSFGIIGGVGRNSSQASPRGGRALDDIGLMKPERGCFAQLNIAVVQRSRRHIQRVFRYGKEDALGRT